MSDQLLCGIYYIKNLMNNKYYIGQSVDILRRWRREKYDLNCEESAWNVHLQRSWRQYGEENFEFQIVELCQPEQLDEREMHWITLYDSYNNGYNQSLGGGGVNGWKHTSESKAKISESNRKTITPERRKEASDRARDYWSDPLNREALQECKRQWWENPINRAKMVDAAKNSGRIYPSGEDHPMFGADRTGINSGHHRSCVQVETGNFYYTLTDASKATGLNLSKICSVCNGSRKTTGGYHWRYATEEEVEEYLREMEVAI